MTDAFTKIPLASKNVTRLEYGEKEIFLVGTAHISRRSIEEVARLIGDVRPDTVCIELDETRYRALVDPTAWRKLDIFQIIREKRVLFFLTSLVLTAYQRRLGEKLGIRPGAEMLAAVEKAQEVGARIVLADRDIQATLKRSFRSLSFWNKSKLLAVLVTAPFAAHEITEEQIEELKDRDTISEMMKLFAQEMPELQRPLIDERDRYLISSIREAPGSRIVGVVGAGHVQGMVGYLEESVDRAALSVIPGPSTLSKVLQWIIPALMFGAFYFGYREHSGEGLLDMVVAWVVPTSVGAGVLTIAAGGKWLTVIAAVAASPITTLNPAVGAGMITGLVEAWLRKPTIEDCESIQTDMLSLRGIYGNPFTRVLLVAVASTIGAALGAWVGAAWVITLL